MTPDKKESVTGKNELVDLMEANVFMYDLLSVRTSWMRRWSSPECMHNRSKEIVINQNNQLIRVLDFIGIRIYHKVLNIPAYFIMPRYPRC